MKGLSELLDREDVTLDELRAFVHRQNAAKPNTLAETITSIELLRVEEQSTLSEMRIIAERVVNGEDVTPGELLATRHKLDDIRRRIGSLERHEKSKFVRLATDTLRDKLCNAIMNWTRGSISSETRRAVANTRVVLRFDENGQVVSASVHNSRG